MTKGINIFLLVLVLLTSTAIVCTAQPMPGGNSGSANYMNGQPDIQSGQSELGVSQFGGYGGNEAVTQGQLLGGKSSKLKCSIWSDKDYYDLGDIIHVYYRISKPCYVKIVNNWPGGKTTVINTWKKAAGTYSIPGMAKEPFGDRTFTLKTWTNTFPQQVCRNSCTYTVGSPIVFLPASVGSVNEPSDEGSVNEPSDEGSVNEPSDEGSVNEPSDEGSVNEPSDDGSVNEPSDDWSVNEPSDDGSVNEPSDDGSVNEPSDGGYVNEPAD